MSLKDRVIQDRNESAKVDLFKKTILNTLLGECDRVSKTPTDEEIFKIIRKSIEGNLLVGTTDKLRENEILNNYLPVMLSDEELEVEIQNILAFDNIDLLNRASMGVVMKKLQTLHLGQYDGKKASEIIKKHLAL